MPVFGKGRKTRERKEFVERQVQRAPFGKRTYGRRDRYIWDRASARMVRGNFPLIFGRKDFILQRFSETGKPVVVLDWGCGRGNAIERFSKEYGRIVNAYGFSKDSYKKWLKIKGAKIIHATAEDLLRYLKNSSIDLIYSRTGLMYLISFSKKDPLSIQRGIQYIEKLIQKLSSGGKIAFDLRLGQRKEISNALKEALAGKAEVEYHRGRIYITKCLCNKNDAGDEI